jgi:hypothetical protein
MNGDLVHKGYVNIVDDSLLRVAYNNSEGILTFEGDDFSLHNYPFVGHFNQFKKHD